MAPYPDALAQPAFHGIAGEIVAAIEPCSEADPAALLMQFLVGFGNVIGHSAHFEVEADKHFTNEFVCLVGGTAAGRKGTSWSQARHPLRRADELEVWSSPAHQAGGLSTGEGLIHAVRDAKWTLKETSKAERKDGAEEYRQELEDEGVSDKRLMVVETEFASPIARMGRDGNTLSPILRQFWDGGVQRVLTKSSPAHATDAHVSVVAHVTPEELRDLLTKTEMANGFGNRFLWVCTRRSKLLPNPEQPSHSNEVIARLREAVAFGSTAGLVGFDPGADRLWSEEYIRRNGDDGRSGLLAMMTSRWEPHVRRLALIYAVLDRSPVVKKVHLDAAFAAWNYCEGSAAHLFGNRTGHVLDERQLQFILDGEDCRRAQSEITRHFNEDTRTLEASRQRLMAVGLLWNEEEETDGRPITWWCAESQQNAA